MAQPKVVEKRSISTRKRITLIAHAPEAQAVSVTGEFSNWSPEGFPLRKGLDGEWQTTLTLEPGEHQYRLRVDGLWSDHAEARKRVPNPFGTENCVLLVS